MAFKSNRFVIIFNGTNSKDNALFSVIGQNIVLKLKPYFEFQGIYKNYTAAEIDNFTYNNGDFIIYLKGPNTGANGTYVKLDGNKVLISGNTTDEAQMAGDKFILTVMGLYEKSHSWYFSQRVFSIIFSDVKDSNFLFSIINVGAFVMLKLSFNTFTIGSSKFLSIDKTVICFPNLLYS